MSFVRSTQSSRRIWVCIHFSISSNIFHCLFRSLLCFKCHFHVFSEIQVSDFLIYRYQKKFLFCIWVATFKRLLSESIIWDQCAIIFWRHCLFFWWYPPEISDHLVVVHIFLFLVTLMTFVSTLFWWSYDNNIKLRWMEMPKQQQYVGISLFKGNNIQGRDSRYKSIFYIGKGNDVYFLEKMNNLK